MKVSYSCTENVETFINRHNKAVFERNGLKITDQNNAKYATVGNVLYQAEKNLENNWDYSIYDLYKYRLQNSGK